MLIDLNVEAEGLEYLRMGNFAVSPDHSLLAFALDTDGSETYALRVKDLASGDLLPDRIENTYYGLEWGNDNRTLYYTTLDPAQRPFKLHRHRLNEDASNDEVVYHEEDERFFLQLYKAKSERYIFFALGSAVTSEVYAIDADHRDGQPVLLQPRVQDMEYFVSHHQSPTGKDRFLILTNWEAENFRVMTAPVDAPTRENWMELIPHSADVMLDQDRAIPGLSCDLGAGERSYTYQDSGSERRSLFRGRGISLPPGGAVGAGVYGLPRPKS